MCHGGGGGGGQEEVSLHLCLNYDISFFSTSQGEAVTDNCKRNYGKTDRLKNKKKRHRLVKQASNDREGERGVSGKRSTEKTSDFWASHCQRFWRIKDVHPHTLTCTHTVASVCLQYALCVEIHATKFHIPVIAFSTSSCEL